MKKVKESLRGTPAPARLQTCGFFVFRTPLLPLETVLGVSAAQSCISATMAGHKPSEPEQVPSAALTLEQHRAWMRQQLANPVIREALLLASTSLAESIEAWEHSPDSERGRKVQRALLRYLSRMATRPTPFGLLAGCSYGELGDHTKLTLDAAHTYRRFTQLDQEQVGVLTAQLLMQAPVAQALHYYSNGTLFVGAGRWRYIESRRQEGEQLSFHLVAVERTPYLDAVLLEAKFGASRTQLVEAVLHSIPTVSVEQATVFIEELIRSQLLCSEVQSHVIGADPLMALSEQLRRRQLGRYAQQVERISAQLLTIDQQGLGQSETEYVAFLQSTAELKAPELSRQLHVDLWKPAVQATLAQEVVDEAARGVALLARLHRPRENRSLNRFKKAFQARYESQSVPLLEALDPECGLGFDEQAGVGDESAALLAGVRLAPPEPAAPLAFSAVDQLLLRRVVQALQTGATQIELLEKELTALPEGEPIPAALAVMGALFVESGKNGASKDVDRFWLRVDAALGPSATSLLGRFCHCDSQLQRQMEALAGFEQSLFPDAVLAEVAHLPPGRAGNIVRRPHLRSYVIPLLSSAAVPRESQLPLDDLWLSMQGEQLILTSASLGKRVLPRLASAHNFTSPRNVSLYRFLCHLQEQEGSASLAFSWGPLATLDYLPRVTSGRLILSPAQWRLDQDLLQSLGALQDWTQQRAYLEGLRAARGLPRYVTFPDGDNTLLVDLESELSVDAFLDAIKSRSAVTVAEFLFADLRSAVTAPEGTFANEVVIPLCTRSPQSHSAPSLPVAGRLQAARSLPIYPLGSEWLYCKLYTGMATTDRVLVGHLTPLLRELQDAGLVQRWFFIRYQDPDWHLRLRFFGTPQLLSGEVMHRLTALLHPLLAIGLLTRVQLDTYAPEYERYGGSTGMRLSEEVFWHDSQAVLTLLPQLVGDSSAQLRWQTTLASMAALLQGLLPDPAHRLQVVQSAHRSFSSEHSVSREASVQIGARFRKERLQLESLLEGVEQQSAGPTLDALHERSARLQPVIAQLHSCERAGQLSRPLTELAQSYLHMTANRILRSAARAQEVLLYDFLARLYLSQQYRGRAAVSPVESVGFDAAAP